MMDDKMTIKGKFKAVLYDEYGNVKEVRENDNLITTAGFNTVLKQVGISGTQPAAFKWCAVGSGESAAAVGNSALGGELARAAVSYGDSAVGAAGSFVSTAAFGAGVGTGAVYESALFNDATTGSMLNRQIFSVINKGANDTLSMEWTISLS